MSSVKGNLPGSYALSDTLRGLLQIAAPGPMPAVYMFLCTAVMIALPRSAPVVLSLLALFGAIEALARAPTSNLPAVPMPLVWWAAFGLFAGLSALWAPSSTEALSSAAQFLAIGGVAYLALWLTLAHPDRLREIGRGACFGIACGLLLVTFETLTDLWLTRQVLTAFPTLRESYADVHVATEAGAVVFVSDNFLNRSTCIATMLIVPYLVLARLLFEGRNFLGHLAVATVYFITVLLLSRHQSSQLALVLAVPIAILSLRSLGAIRKVVAAAWILAVMLSPFIAASIPLLGIQGSAYVPLAAEARLDIWAETARWIAANPWTGHGASSASAILGDPSLAQHLPPGEHAHNAYLQIWQDLGMVGAVFALLLGLSLLMILKRRGPSQQRALLIQFTLGISMLGTSFGIWQSWYQSTLFVAAVLLAVSYAIAENARRSR